MVTHDPQDVTSTQHISIQLDSNWGYFYEPFLTFLFRNRKYSLLFGYLILMAIWLLTSIWCDYICHVSASFPNWWAYCAYYVLAIGCPILFLSLAKNKLRDSLPAMLDILSDEAEKNKCLNTISLMGNRKRQAIFCVSFGSLCVVVLSVQRIVLFNNTIVLFHIGFWTFLAGMITAAGLWLAITSIIMASRLTQFKQLQLDFINPAGTDGVSTFASLMGYYATLFALQVLVWEVPYIYTSAQDAIKPLWNINTIPFYISSTVFACFLAFVLCYFLYPQFKIIILVRNHKRLLLDDVQRRIREIYFEEPQADKAPLLGQYLALYKEIDTNKGSLPFQNILGFGVSFLASLALSLASNIPHFIKTP